MLTRFQTASAANGQETCPTARIFAIQRPSEKVSDGLLPNPLYLTATAAFAAAAAAVAFFRFEHEFSQEEEYAGKHNQADDNILSHHSILEEIW